MSNPNHDYCRLTSVILLGVVVALLALAAPVSAATYDYCSSIVVRPDQRYKNPATCTETFSDEEIGSGADAVWMGDFTDVSNPLISAPPRTCYPQPSHVANAAYVQRLKNVRASRGLPPLEIVHMHRFDLVPAVLLAQPQFRVSHLVATNTPWSAVTGFFTNDVSPACTPSRCRWSDSWGGVETRDPGLRMRDFIDRQADAGAYGRVVYYLARPDGSSLYWPTSTLGDLRNPDYRAWRVAEAREALRVGGYTTIDLNHKLHQYRSGLHWIGSGSFRTVEAVKSYGDTLWSAPAIGYGYQQYTQALVALASDLRAAGVPYSFMIALRAWKSESYDDLSTPVNEAELIRTIMKGAKVVYLDRPFASTPPGMLEEATAGLAQYGVRSVAIDQSCGLLTDRLPPPTAPSVSR